MDKKAAVRTRDEIGKLSFAGLDSTTFRARVVRSLRRVLPLDAVWFATADPTTLLFTSSFVEEIPEALTPAFVTNEFLEVDFNKWVSLAGGRNVESLFRATKGRPEDSARFRDILAPLGLGDELRAALMDGGSCWGYICLHRERDSQGFRLDEIEFLQSIVRHVARGLRAGLLIESLKSRTLASSPGMLILSDDLSVVGTSQSAEQWLNEIQDLPKRKELPQSIYAVARRLQEIEASEQVSLSPQVRIRTRSGHWLLLHAMRLSVPGGEGRVGIVLEPAASGEVVPLTLLAYGLTQREAEVAQLVLRGTSTAAIAETLCISALTVQQHLKAIFEKTGVSSRRELSARVLYEQYVPRLASGETPSLHGGFIDTR